MSRCRGAWRAKAGVAIAALLAGSGATAGALAADATASQTAVAPATTPGGAAENAAGATVSGIGTPAPPVGVSVRLGNLDSVFAPPSAAPGAVPGRPPGLTITPTLGLSEEFTDNVFYTATQHESDFITGLTPGVLVNIQTPSVGGTVSYTPAFQWYARNSSQDTVSQYVNGSFNATLLPKTLLLSAGTNVSEVSTSGGLAPGGVTSIPSSTRATTAVFYVTPSFVHQFGDTGTLRLSYSLQLANQSGSPNSVAGATEPFFLASSALTNQEIAYFTTGPALGRFNDTTDVIASEYSQAPILDGAHQYFVVNTLRFALDRMTYIFGSAGYENISYPGSLPPFDINGGVWAAGFGLTPAPRSAVIAGYRHAYGINSPILQVAIGLTARTRLAIVYSSFVATGLQSLQSTVSGSAVDAAGNSINSDTGAPVLVGNQLLSQQNGLMRNSTLTASLVTTWPRDTLSFSLLQDQQKLLANAPGMIGFSQESWSGGVGWAHSLTPRLTAASYLQIGSTNSEDVGTGWTPVLGGQVSLAYQLTPTLSASLVYQFTNQWASVGGNTLQNMAIVALQNTF